MLLGMSSVREIERKSVCAKERERSEDSLI